MTDPSTHTRAAGILMPVSSLPSPYGIGSFGAAAYNWVNFLAAAGQKYWQVLPLGPTSYGDSPYQSFSAFAGNPYFIDLDLLCGQGLLTPEECAAPDWGDDPGRVDYGALFRHRESLLRAAFARFADRDALATFRAEHARWIEDYALYTAIKGRMGLRSWTEWDDDVRLRDPAALARWREETREDVNYHVFVQYLFFRQWSALKKYANDHGVGIIGDIPIYVAMDSADTWADSRLFLLDKDKRPIDVAGCPPDFFSEDGQLWGNPLYRWDVHKAEGYAWWLARLKANLAMYDLLRIDHFRGLESYYAIPYGNMAETGGSGSAVGGEWRKGPGLHFIGAVNRALGAERRIIAEDLGFLTPEVRQLLRDSGYAGMKILQFAFDSREKSNYMPHTYRRHCIVLTGSHDNDTLRGWFDATPPEDLALAREYLAFSDDADGNKAFIRAALASVANLAVIPIQDYLGLGNEARVNIPSTIGGNNWRWRIPRDAISPELTAGIARITELYGR